MNSLIVMSAVAVVWVGFLILREQFRAVGRRIDWMVDQALHNPLSDEEML